MKTKSKIFPKIFPTITQAFLNRVRTEPDRQTFHYKEGTAWKALTWQEFYENVRWISLGLLELNVKPGENVCLLSNTRLEWAATDMGILGARAVTVPIYASNTPEDCKFIINHCEARILFVEDNKQLEKILSIRNELPKIEKIIPFSFNANPETAQRNEVLSLSALRELGKRAFSQGKEKVFDANLESIKPSDVFTICYTSGTTGVPKGVVLTHDSLTSVIEDIEIVLGKDVGEKDVLLSFLPISHIFGKVESMAAYHFGWKVYYAESVDKLFVNIGEVKPTILFAVPRVFEKVYSKIKAGLDDAPPLKKKLFGWAMKVGKSYFSDVWNSQPPAVLDAAQYAIAKRLVFSKVYAKFGGRLRMCVAGGAPLPREIGEFLHIIGIPVLEGYGLTETCAPVAVNPFSKMKFGAVGKPLAEVTIKIAEDGEILVKSRKVFKEYYKNPQATQEVKNSEGWFHTGDIGHLDANGYLKITDRKKDLIVTSGGKNIAPQKIENLAKTYKYISQFVVYGDQRNYLTALITLDKEEVIKYAKENHILFSEYSELVKHAKIQEIVQSAINDVNKNLASYETIKKFKILPNEFTIESGELTPSMKIRRRYCNEKYKSELDAMYGGATA